MSTCVVQERDAVLAIVASVLHLGNISFTHGDMDNAMLLDERSEDAMYIVAELMQVSSFTTVPLAPCRSCFVIKCVSLCRCISRADSQSLMCLSICFLLFCIELPAAPCLQQSLPKWPGSMIPSISAPALFVCQLITCSCLDVIPKGIP